VVKGFHAKIKKQRGALMNLEIYKSMMLESENLTDNMEDNEAKRLLNWGIEQLPQIMFEGDAENNVSSLMRTMRTIIGQLPEVNIDNLKSLAAHYSQAFGMPQAISDSDYEGAKEKLSALRADDALTFLIDWLVS
jgi:hypothetical protein